MKPLVIGHRGCAYLPENTIEAIRHAYELGCDAVELDVHLTNDKKLVVIHDPSVDRTTDGKGLVENKSLKRLQMLDAGDGLRIPTLEKVFKTFKNTDLQFFIELKNYKALRPLVKLITKYKFEHRCVVMCFAHKLIQIVKKLNPKIKTGALEVSIPVKPDQIVIAAKADYALFYYQTLVAARILLAPMIRKLKKRGIKVISVPVAINESLTANEFHLLNKMGIDGYISNKPEKILKLLGKKKNYIKRLVKSEKLAKRKESKFESKLNRLVELHRKKVTRDVRKFKKFIQKLEKEFFD